MAAKATTSTRSRSRANRASARTASRTTGTPVEQVRKHRLSFMTKVTLTAIIAAFLLIIANSAMWVNQAFFNTQNFTNTAVTAIESESSRQALASEVVDKALANQPAVKSVVGPTATKLVSGLLGTSQFNQLLTTAMTKAQIYLTSNNRQSVVIDLSGVKTTLNKIVSVANNLGAETNDAPEKISNVPDQIVLINSNNVPDFYQYGLIFLWVGPICAILALGLLAYPYIKKGDRFYRVAWVQGLVITLAGFVSLLVGPLFKPPVLANIQSENLRIVVGNIYNAFIGIFNRQTYLLIAIGVAWAVLPAVFNTASTMYHRRAQKQLKSGKA